MEVGGRLDGAVKPFELAELKARLRSLLRRRDGRASSQIIHGAIVLDPITHTVLLRDVAVAVVVGAAQVGVSAGAVAPAERAAVRPIGIVALAERPAVATVGPVVGTDRAVVVGEERRLDRGE